MVSYFCLYLVNLQYNYAVTSSWFEFVTYLVRSTGPRHCRLNSDATDACQQAVKALCRQVRVSASVSSDVGPHVMCELVPTGM